ncbi:TIGR03943 family putative permease subunit [Paenibacillus gansuensis]|uniref:TIGR03943 family putative permease subunit n=1 Tax=Paenibacillus gansuensis TaxID=306542 RepID=A0ABW5P9W8_9BACL
MADLRIRKVHTVLRAVILAGLALFIADLVKRGSMSLYIAPRMELYVKCASLVLYAGAVYHIYRLFRLKPETEHDCGCGHDHAPPSSSIRSLVIYSLFIVPVAMGILLPDHTLSSSMAAQKGMNWSAASALKTGNDAGSAPSLPEGKKPSLDSLFPSTPFTEEYAAYAKQLYSQDLIRITSENYIDALTTLDLYQEAFAGKRISVSGFLFRDETMAPDEFAVSRFSVQCCSADALPLGILAELRNGRKLQDDQWFRVTGKLTVIKRNGEPRMKLELSSAVAIQPPKDPYVYQSAELPE